MLTCREAAQLLSDSLDRELPLRQRIALRIHLFMCKLCPRFRNQILFLKETLNQYRLEGVRERLLTSESLSAEARERIQRAIAGGLDNP
jgi:hypothetical protein